MSLSFSLTVGVLSFLAVSTLWSIIFKKNSLVRLICISAVAILSFIGAIVAKKIITTPEKLIQIVSMIPGTEELIATFTELCSSSEILAEVVTGFSAAMLTPAIFAVIFIILWLFSFIIRGILRIVQFALGLKFSAGVLVRAAFGFAYGFIMVFCLLVPVSAYLNTASAALPEIKELGVVDEATYGALEAPVKEASDSTALKLHNTLGGKLAAKPMTSITVKANGEKIATDLDTEVKFLLGFASDAAKLVSMPMEQYTEVETQALEQLAASIPDSKLLSLTASEVVYLATDAWMKDAEFLGASRPTLGEELEPLLDRTVIILNRDSKTPDYLCADINTFAKIVSKLILSAKPAEPGQSVDIAAALTSDTTMRDVLTEINKNPRMRPLIPVVANIGLKMMAENIGISAESTADILIESAVIDGASEISEQDMQEFINSIADVFASALSLTNGSIKDIGGLCDSLGAMLDVLASNESLYGKEKTEALTALIFKSAAVSDVSGIKSAEIDAMLAKMNEKNVSYSALLGTVASTADVFDSIKSGSAVTSDQMGELVFSLTGQGAGEVIATVITEEKLTDMGFKDNGNGNVGAAAELLRGVFTEVSSVTDPEKHENEQAALNRLIGIAVDANSENGEAGDAFGENGRLDCTAEELIDDILASEAVCSTVTDTEMVENPFGITLSSSDKAAVEAALNARRTAENGATIDNLALLLGI